MTQPFLLEDQVEVDGEVGHIEEIQSQYVIMRTLDERRLVIPLTWFLANVSQVWIESGYTSLTLNGSRIVCLTDNLSLECQ